MRVAVVSNAASGRGRAGEAAHAIAAALAGRGCIVVPWSIGMLDERPEALGTGVAAVVAVGGDGTVRSVAARLARTGIPLAIVPTGTENLAARAHGFLRPLPDLAPLVAAAIVARRARQVDVGWLQVEGGRRHAFLVMASAGFDADVVAALAARRHGPISHASYLAPIVRTAIRWRAPCVRCREDAAGILAGRGTLVVANAGAYALGLDPGRGADPADGLLDIVRVPGGSAAGIARVAWSLLRSREAGALPRLRLPEATLRFDRPVRWQADGDAVPAAPGSEARAGVWGGALALVDLAAP